MKKIILALSLTVSATFLSQAQGLINFGSSTQNMSTNNTIASYGAITSGKITPSTTSIGYYFALFYSATSTAVNGTQTAAIQGSSPNYAFNDSTFNLYSGLGTNSSAGRFNNSTPNTDGSATIAGISGGATAQFVVVGWSANLGNSVSALENSLAAGTPGFLGQSVVSGPISLGNGALLPTPNLFQNTAPYIQAFTLGALPVPEPGTMALAALSGASLLLFRRRK
jgi:hypothetical protein